MSPLEVSAVGIEKLIPEAGMSSVKECTPLKAAIKQRPLKTLMF
jgi:hypothetical protein